MKPLFHSPFASPLTRHDIIRLSLAMAGLGFQSAGAADKAWSTAPVSANFSGLNWTPGQTPGAASSSVAITDSLFFGTSSVTAVNNDNLAFNHAGLTFNSSASPFIIGGNSFTLSGGITNNSTTFQAIANPLALSATQTVNTSTGNVNLSGFISGAFGLTKTGSGTLSLTGGNSYTGTTTLSAGTVSIVGNTGIGAAAAPTTLDGGTLRFNLSGTADNTHVWTVGAGGGTINVNNPSAATFTYRLNATTLLLGSGPLTVTGNGALGTSGTGNGTLVLNVAGAASTFNGTLTMQDGGFLELNNNTALNSAVAVTLGNNGGVSVNTTVTAMASPVIVNGTNSALNFANGNAGVVTGNITLNNDLLIRMADWYNYATARSGAISGTISGTGGITVGGLNSTLTLSADNTYSGATLITQNAVTLAANATSSIADSSSVSLSNAALNFDETAGIIDKIKDTAPVSVRNNSFINFTGNAADTTETIGNLEIAGGNNSVKVTTNGTAVTTLAAAALNRSNLGTSLVIGSSLGQQLTSVGKITLVTPPSGVNLIGAGGSPTGTGSTLNLGIVPWLAGATAAANSAARDFVTYDATHGLRPLVSAEYAASIAAATAGDNVKSSTDEAGLGAATLNSLFLVPAAAQAITGTGGTTLTLSSGALASGLATGAPGTTAFNSTISGFDAVAFGNDEAVVTVAQTGGTITLGSPVSVTGTGGLTKTGEGTLALAAANTYTGQTTVNQGTLSATVTNNMFNGTTGTPLVLANNANLNVNATTQKVTSVTITGSAGRITGTGGTVDLGGDVTFDAVLNPNSAGLLSVSNLNLNGTRTFNIGDSSPLTGNDVSLSSVVANGSVADSGLTKTGAGTLGVSGASTYSGPTTINGGILSVDTLADGGLTSNIGASPATANNLVINGGALRHTGVATSTNRNFTFGDNGAALIASGTANAALTWNGNAIFATGNAPRTLTLAGTSTGANAFASPLVDNGTGALSLTKAGAGTWSLTGTNTYSGPTTIIQGTLQIGNGGTSGSIAGDVVTGAGTVLAFNRSDASSYGGVISGFGGLTKSGTGTLSLTGKSTMTGNINLAGGTTSLSGTVGGNTSNGNFRVGTVANTPATLNILPGANNLTRFNLFIGDNGDAVNIGTSGAAVYQSGGSLVLTQGAGVDNLRVGSNARAYGYYGMSGGAITSNEIGIGASLADTIGVVEVSAGTVTSTNWLTLGRGSATSSGLLNVTGGTVNAARIELNNGSPLTAGALSVVNVAGGNVNATGAGTGLNLASGSNTAGIQGVVNLLPGGTATATIVTGSQANHTAALNFNGGTLKAHTTNSGATFLTSANIDSVNVYAGGGTVDNNGTSITIGRPLTPPAGFGVSSTSIAVPSGGTGYIGAPLVKFTGGTGTGATGYAVLSGGVVSSITMTSPGTGYTSGDTLTATFFGAAATAATAVTGIPVAANATTGGMTFQGIGTTTLSGLNTYTGTTTVNAGTLAVNGTALADTGKLVINGGKVEPTGTEVVGTLFFGAAQKAAGTWGSTLSAATHKDNIHFSGIGVVNVTTGVNYAIWADLNANDEAADLDFDDDGAENGVEYFMDAAAGFTALPVPVGNVITWINGGNIATSAYGTQFVVQTSLDLVNWSPVDVGDLTANTDGPGGSLTYTLPSGEIKVFARLKVTPD